MVFTFSQARKLSPEEASPMQALISRALDTFTKGTKASYLPQQLQNEMTKSQLFNQYYGPSQEADIYAKRNSPFAALANNPLLLQSPELQRELVNRLIQNGQGGQGGQSGKSNSPIPTFADRTKKDYQTFSALGDELAKAGQGKVLASKGAAMAENYLPFGGELASGIFGVNPELSNKSKDYDTALSTLKSDAVKTGRVSEAEANKIFRKDKDESYAHVAQRIQSVLPEMFNPLQNSEQENGGMNNPQMDQEDTRAADNQVLIRAANISQQLSAEGYDVPETVIFQYLQKNPGKVSLPKLLKAAGVRYAAK